MLLPKLSYAEASVSSAAGAAGGGRAGAEATEEAVVSLRRDPWGVGRREDGACGGVRRGGRAGEGGGLTRRNGSGIAR